MKLLEELFDADLQSPNRATTTVGEVIELVESINQEESSCQTQE
jgi:hypothetical protein